MKSTHLLEMCRPLRVVIAVGDSLGLMQPALIAARGSAGASPDALGTMNMAYVKVHGHVVRSLTYDPVGGYLAFWVDDGTGEMRIASYRDVTQALLATGKVPALGDEVTVAGTLRIREDYVSLTLNVPEHLELNRPDPVSLKANAITTLDEGLRVRLVGEVRRVYAPYVGLTLLTLGDDTGEIDVAVDETLVALTGALPEVVEGQGIEVVGAVSLYKDTPQVIPSSVADIVLSAAPPEEIVAVEKRKLGELSPDDERSRVWVQGRVVTMEGFNGGLKATLDDGTAQITVVLWDSVYTALDDPAALDVGADVEVEGEVRVYQGELELVPEASTDIAITNPAPEIPWMLIKDLKLIDVGRVVRLRGVLGVPDAFSAGVKAQLDDGSGEITVLLWSNIAQALEPPPAEGMLVEVIGVIQEYQQALEIIPRSPQDWRTGR
jgi:DNA/RNA endonuclease YhcR with UshA esterase domain